MKRYRVTVRDLVSKRDVVVYNGRNERMAKWKYKFYRRRETLDVKKEISPDEIAYCNTRLEEFED